VSLSVFSYCFLVFIIEVVGVKDDFVLDFRGQSKQDEALDCYGRAANLFKMAKKWSQAGQVNESSK